MPKFQGGDAIDTAHCIALTHEILRCEEAFKDFEALASQSIMVGENRALAFKMYNSYARFVHHLYEFMAACFVRDQHDTAAGSGKDATRFIEGYIRHHAQRLLTGRRAAILNGTAPAWENALSAYPENVPADFASDFRLSFVAFARHSRGAYGRHRSFSWPSKNTTPGAFLQICGLSPYASSGL